MPTSAAESDKLIEITLRRLPPAEALAYAQDLWTEIGETTDNVSVKTTLRMALERAERAMPKKAMPLGGKVMLVSWVVLHFALILGNVACAITLALCTVLGWKIQNIVVACPIICWVVWLGTARGADCVLNRVENIIRKRYRRPPIAQFLKHYIERAWTAWHDRRQRT